jgi:hypothetical protein
MVTAIIGSCVAVGAAKGKMISDFADEILTTSTKYSISIEEELDISTDKWGKTLSKTTKMMGEYADRNTVTY